MSKRKLTYKDFKNYFGNSLPNKDKHAFEKDMMRDDFEQDAFEGLSNLNDEELEKDIFELKAKIEKRAKRTQRLIPDWYKYAASAIIIVGVGLSIFFLNSRFWQDSMMKEQLSEEMEIVDSLFEAEMDLEEIPVSDQKDVSQDSSSGLVAVNQEVEQIQEIDMVDDAIEISDENIIYDADVQANEITANESVDDLLVEFEEEEFVEEDAILLAEAVEKEAKAEENAKGEDLQVTSQKSAQPMASRAKKSVMRVLEDTDKADSSSIVKTDAILPGINNKTELQKYILDKINYTALSSYVGEYSIEFSFTVTSNGDISNFSFTQSPDEIFNTEIKRVMNEAGNWIPATNNNQNISSEIKLSLIVKVQ